MKYIYWFVGLLLGLAFILVGLPQIASERVEVVDLHTTDVGSEHAAVDCRRRRLPVSPGRRRWLWLV